MEIGVVLNQLEHLGSLFLQLFTIQKQITSLYHLLRTSSCATIAFCKQEINLNTGQYSPKRMHIETHKNTSTLKCIQRFGMSAQTWSVTRVKAYITHTTVDCHKDQEPQVLHPHQQSGIATLKSLKTHVSISHQMPIFLYKTVLHFSDRDHYQTCE